MSVPEFLQRMINELDRQEVVDGDSVSEAAAMVDLSIAYSPVVEENLERINPALSVPKPVSVLQQKDGRYRIDHPEHGDFSFVDEHQLKRMRARYLLLRGYYYRHLKALSYPTQQQVLAWYFPEGVWMPPAHSDLAKKMGIVE